MKDLIIIGKAPINKDISELKKQNNELWLCGTDERKGGDLYFELHNIIVDHSNVIYSLPEEVYTMGLPVNNTISAMLIYAYIKGYKNIKIIGAPMVANDEYIAQRPALAYIIGFFNGKGLNIEWEHLPKNTNYGRINCN